MSGQSASWRPWVGGATPSGRDHARGETPVADFRWAGDSGQPRRDSILVGRATQRGTSMVHRPEGSLEHVDDEAFIIVKAAPRASNTYGETVCIAAIDHNGSWVRLYPVSFRQLEDAQKFGRWDRIRYRWRKPAASADRRVESRRLDQNSIEIVGKLRERDRHAFLNRAAVISLRAEFEAGRSLALLQCEIIDSLPA